MGDDFKCFATSERHLGAVTALAIAPDGKTLVSGSEDRSLKVWNLETGQLLRTLSF
jgi:WD40 repeat protein